MSEEPPLEELAALLEDETARRILTEIYRKPMSANSLTERCDASEPTVYRRLEDMRRCGLLVERTRPDTERGHHYTEYATNLERIVVEIDDDGIDFRVDRRERMADRFTRLVEEM
ncbi:winged helix-turn-helix domain-containing protein [Natrarchaeobius oligotrophus]|uniref:ArsR family transcriptional regulator n=1 Tax=Natrarchaeobius chitinivorans TaxID=1679083 RepID=A0A3N6M205_NATCH|nr:winged helix-turn-helix domain-containing protein [Natrarchaeobius chitinivorans]RQG97388.1 ArsR family transcriptional regulator [Natrarchaeobius chitinivorans]